MSNADSEGWSAEDAPYVPPRPIIVCNNCRTPFDCKRDTPREFMNPHRCRWCGELHDPGEAIFERAYASEWHQKQGLSHNKQRELYIIDGPGDLVKVGVATRPNRRLSSMRSSSPYEIEMVATFDLPNAYEVEQAIHDQLSEYQATGEWFDLPDRSLESFTDAVSVVVENNRED